MIPLGSRGWNGKVGKGQGVLSNLDLQYLEGGEKGGRELKKRYKDGFPSHLFGIGVGGLYVCMSCM